MALDKEKFESKCIEVIEQIVLLSAEQDRNGAIKVAESMLAKAKQKSPNGGAHIDVFQRVYDEFVNCSDREYALLKKQLFDHK